MGDRTRSQEELFWSKVEAGGVCWEWTGATVQGYGAFGSSGTRAGSQRAHRWAYEHLVGAVPPELTLDHLCRNRACVNPDHLEAVISEVNVLRGSSPPAMNARKTHCANGHEFTPENTYVASSASGRKYRQCRMCHLAVSRAYKARRRAAAAGDK